MPSTSVSRHRDTPAMSAEGTLRRSRLLDVAAQLFADQGFEATTLSDIALAAGLKKASVYHYFPSKVSVLLGVLNDGIADLLSAAREAATIEDPAERLDALLAVHLHNFGHKLAHVVVFLFERRVLERELGNSREAKAYLRRRREYDELFVDCIRQGQAAGVFRPDDPVVLAYGVLGMLNWMVQWYDPEGRLSMSEIGETLRACARNAVADVVAGTVSDRRAAAPAARRAGPRDRRR